MSPAFGFSRGAGRRSSLFDQSAQPLGLRGIRRAKAPALGSEPVATIERRPRATARVEHHGVPVDADHAERQPLSEGGCRGPACSILISVALDPDRASKVGYEQAGHFDRLAAECLVAGRSDELERRCDAGVAQHAHGDAPLEIEPRAPRLRHFSEDPIADREYRTELFDLVGRESRFRTDCERETQV